MEKAEKDRKKKLSLRFVLTQSVIENSKKIQKIKKFLYGFISSQNTLEKAEKERIYNKYYFVSSFPDP